MNSENERQPDQYRPGWYEFPFWVVVRYFLAEERSHEAALIRRVPMVLKVIASFALVASLITPLLLIMAFLSMV